MNVNISLAAIESTTVGLKNRIYGTAVKELKTCQVSEKIFYWVEC